jgi:hypothetical protein
LSETPHGPGPITDTDTKPGTGDLAPLEPKPPAPKPPHGPMPGEDTNRLPIE